MLKSEYESASTFGEGENVIVTIKVSNHKTGRTERASVSCSGHILQQLRMWIDVTRPLFPESDLVFPKYEGTGPILHLTTRVRNVAEENGLQLPTSQIVRSVVEIKATTLDPARKTLVARALSHSQATAEKHYRALETSKRAEGYAVVGELVGVAMPSVGPAPKRSRRKGFSQLEIEVIRKEFSEEIRLKKPPLRARAERFLKEHSDMFQSRTTKDIYDKVRNEWRNKYL